MKWWEWFVPGSIVALELSVIVFLLRLRAWRNFPVFSIYIFFVLLRDLSFAATVSHPPTYFLLYWRSASLDILLTILATLESFWRVLRIFQLLRWFRFVLPGAILAALTYAAWQGYSVPPVEATPLQAAIINATVAAHYVILTVALLFFALVALLGTQWRIHEYRLMLGFGFASLAVAFGGTIRAAFGSRFQFISKEAEPIGYLITLLIWLTAVIHPVPKAIVVPAPSVEMLEDMKFQLRNFRSFVRKDRR